VDGVTVEASFEDLTCITILDLVWQDSSTFFGFYNCSDKFNNALSSIIGA
jgi:hypothetical protein